MVHACENINPSKQMQQQHSVEGSLEVLCVNGKTVAASVRQGYPLKFIVLHNQVQQEEVLWAYEVNYGGGLVSGDCITIGLKVGQGATMAITGQSSMKIYRAKKKGEITGITQHHLNATVAKDALLCLAYPPVTCFADAEYDQTQIIRLADATSNVIVVEWSTSGRVSTGESWDFSLLQTKNEVWIDDVLLIRDAVRLTNADGGPTVRERMGSFTSMATIIIVGPRVMTYANNAIDEVGKMQINGNATKKQVPNLICSASPLKSPKNNNNSNNNNNNNINNAEITIGAVIKVAANTSGQVLDFIQLILSNAWLDLIGDDPYK